MTAKKLINTSVLALVLFAFSTILGSVNVVNAQSCTNVYGNVYGTYGISTCAPTSLFNKNDPRAIAPEDVVILSSTVGLGILAFVSGKALKTKLAKSE
ncbi:MAG: hypothetical protein ABIM99_03905 [Candidatus Dojkabacteria bacterium]